MPSEIIKTAPSVDLYMEWSSVVEAPTFVGTRAEVLAYLGPATHNCPSCACKPSEERLDRADLAGTSAIGGWGCGWGDSGHIYQQRGVLPRSRFEAFARAAAADDVPAMLALLDPFEDER